MKVRESGMPEDAYWSSFFDPDPALAALDCNGSCRDVVEFGCGYGLFTLAASRVVSGRVFALDIEPDMVAITRRKAADAGADRVVPIVRDFVSGGTGLPEMSCDYAIVFNILHLEDPVALLSEAYRVLTKGGRVGIMHWRYDASTPRGPSMAIRPKPEQCVEWAERAGFQVGEPMDLPCCPFHYGLVGKRVQD